MFSQNEYHTRPQAKAAIRKQKKDFLRQVTFFRTEWRY
ncbi:hypothetical protein HMPREF1144_1412 [Klebsiella sp. OBRC7]|nr:hypothetical protein A225_1193 [Klebsiella michiganensis E718]AWF54147.1 hypothetical protein CSC12_4949 [Klebsiella michiganensis]EJU26881.1 hypothetical protein HMPREF1144_1412 [Klebsiella sp. OBRC7]EUB38306.1 hypothetical protein HMPREF1502_5556 [Klebsiella sp. AS10]